MQTKKLLGSALALAMMWPGQASAELLKNLKMSGSFEVQGIRANNVEDFATAARIADAPAGAATNRDEIADVQHRILVSLDWDLLDDVHARTTLRKNDRNYGDGGAGAGSQTLNQVQDQVRLDEAWVKVDKVFGAMDFTMGRQFLGTPGDIIAYYGPKEKLWGMPVTALDMMRADWAGESFTVSALAGKPEDNNANAALRAHDEQDIRALLFGLRGQENIAAGAYIWNVEQHRNVAGVGVPAGEATDGGRNSRLWVVGAKVKAMMGPLWIGGEFAKNYGIIREDGDTQTAPTASAVGWAAQLDLGAKLDVDGVAAFTPWGKFALGTGRQSTRENRDENFYAVAPDFRPGIVYGRFGTGAPNGQIGSGFAAADRFASNSLQNRVIWGAGLKVNPAAVNKLTAGVSFWDFRRHRATFGPNTNPNAMGQKHFGSEIDLDATWDHSDNVQFGVGVGRFQPGQYIHTVSQSTTGLFASAHSRQGVNAATAGYFDVKIKWGGQQ